MILKTLLQESIQNKPDSGALSRNGEKYRSAFGHFGVILYD